MLIYKGKFNANKVVSRQMVIASRFWIFRRFEAMTTTNTTKDITANKRETNHLLLDLLLDSSQRSHFSTVAELYFDDRDIVESDFGDFECEVFIPERDMTTDEIILRFKQLGMVPGKTGHLLAHGVVQSKTLVALGSPAKGSMADPTFPALDGLIPKPRFRELDQPRVGGWEMNHRISLCFLAVRRKQP